MAESMTSCIKKSMKSIYFRSYFSVDSAYVETNQKSFKSKVYRDASHN